MTAGCRTFLTGIAIALNADSPEPCPGNCGSIVIPPPHSKILVQEQGSGYFGSLLHAAICRRKKINKRFLRNLVTFSSPILSSYRPRQIMSVFSYTENINDKDFL